MKRLSLLCVSALAVLPACAGQGEETSETTGVSYPYLMADGALACGDGKDQGRNVEYYYLDKINARLKADQELATFARERGVEEVTSCESARAFNEIDSDYRDAKHDAEALPADGFEGQGEIGVDAEAELASGLPADEFDPPDAEVDKIADGQTSGYLHAVQLFTDVGSCSGVLISGNWLLTAAHCFSASGTQTLTVKNKDHKIIASGTFSVVRHPGWSGTTGDGDDLALVRKYSAPLGWDSPNNTETAWRRVFGRRLYSNSYVNIYGYGVINDARDGAGTLRTNSYQIRVDWDSSGFIGMNRVLGEGAACNGDSGGPAILLNQPYEIVAGVDSYHLNTGGSKPCPGEGNTFYYTQVGGGSSATCSTGGTATSHSCWIQDTINSDAGTNDKCTRYTVNTDPDHAYTYLKCWEKKYNI